MKYKFDFKHGFTNPEVVARRCLVKKMFLNISQNSLENTCTRVFFNKVEALAQAFSCDFCEISKNTVFYRTFPVAASLNRGCLHCAIVKALCLFQGKRYLKDIQFFL